MLKRGCTLPNLSKRCLHSSTAANFHPVPDGDGDLPEKVKKDMVAGHLNVLPQKNLMRKTRN